jgi:2-amino-4-deoxychorismate synthase
MYNKPFIISKKKWEHLLKYSTWTIKKYSQLSEIDENIYQVFITPFSQAKELSYEVKESNEKIISLIIEEEKELSLEEFISTFLSEEIKINDWIKEFLSQKEYEQIVEDVVKKEIWNWEGSNFCIAQKLNWKIDQFNINKALTIFYRLLTQEYWSYLTYIFFDGNEFFIWASPEKNVSKENNIVRMNPISWTFRKWPYENYKDFKKDFLPFLNDKKEINELFMSVDEELKMMSSICPTGWIIVWPILKEMSNLIHTEYLLSWETKKSSIEVFRESMWACTVVWSPLENAFKIIKKYEKFDRRYYAWAITYIKKDFIDSSIMIRSVNIKLNWDFEICVWASLVKDSIPENEYLEIKTKSKWIMNSILGVKSNTKTFLQDYYLDDEIQETIQKRNQYLNNLLFFKQNLININTKKNLLIINNEDNFTNMIWHILSIIWYKVEIKKFYEIIQEDLEKNDLVLIWPWPWNPTEDTIKNNKNLEIIDYLVKNNKKFFWICLWNQLICRYFWIKLLKKEIPTQWEQIEINLFWEKEKVAFYNTFAWYIKNSDFKEKEDNFHYSKNDKDGEIYAIKWKNFFSFQFHPESILTQNWLLILEKYLNNLTTLWN